MAGQELLLAVAGALGALVAIWKAFAYLSRRLRPVVRNVIKRITGVDRLEQCMEEMSKAHVELREATNAILNEMKPNSGSSLRDVINRIEHRQIKLDERNRALMQENASGIFETDANGLCIWVNRRYTRITGRTPAEVKGYGWVNCIHPDDRNPVEDEWRRAMIEEREFQMSYRMITPDGNVTPVRCLTHRMSSPRGDTIGYLGIITPQE